MKKLLAVLIVTVAIFTAIPAFADVITPEPKPTVVTTETGTVTESGTTGN